MNILYVCADWGIPIRGDKGASIHVREFVNTLSRMGHRVALLFANAGAGNPDPAAQLIEVKPEPTPKTRAREAARWSVVIDPEDKPLSRELDKLAYDARFPERAFTQLTDTRFAPDVVYERFSLFNEGGAATAARLDVPYVLEVNAPLIEEEERHRVLRLRAIAETIQHRCFHQASHIVTVSQPLKNYIEALGIPSERVSCLPNGVDTARFHPGVDPGPVRARYGLGRRPVVGFVGSLKPWHGLSFLFDAMHALSARDDESRLLLVGAGPGFRDAVERAREPALRDRVVLAGSVPHHDVPAHLAAMDLTVAPYSEADSFYFSPLKVLESLAAGRPVVAPRLGQLNDLVQDGITGLLYPPGHLDAFVGHVHRLASDSILRQTMADHARRDAVASLSWEHVVQQAVAIMTPQAA